MTHHTLTAIIPDEATGLRVDQALSQLFSQFSRSQLQNLIKAGQVKVDGENPRTRDKVLGGESVVLQFEDVPQIDWQAEELPLEIVYEDDDLLVVNKPVGVVVHPAAGHASGTLCNALLHHHPDAELLPRAGVIHRLDKDTSGLLVVAKTPTTYQQLVSMMQEREIKREYLAVVYGAMTAGGTIDEPIGRHPVDRKRMAVKPLGKDAVTHYRIKQRFDNHTVIDVQLETGRTHQIRVHMAYIHYPIVGDQTYGGRLRIPKGCADELKTYLQSFKRQALHARKLSFIHPVTQQPLEFSSPLPEDIVNLIALLESHQRESD